MLNSVDEVVAAVGGPSKAAKLAKVGVSAISNWKGKGAIPAEYFALFSDELDRLGHEVERSVFTFKASTGASA